VRLAFALLLLQTFPASPPPPKFVPIRASEIAGCYELTMSAWTPRNSSEWYQPPRRFELTLEPIAASPYYRIRPLADDRNHIMASWTVTDRKEATLTWSTGFVGLEARLRKERKTADLVGTARTFTDVVPSPFSTATVTAHRIACQPAK